MTNGMRRSCMAAGVALLLVVALWAGTTYVYGLAVEMDHSRFRSSDSIAEARERGALVHLPELADSVVHYTGRPLRVREAWIEAETQVRYRAYLPGTRRLVKLGTHRLLLRVVEANGTALLSQDRHYLASALCVAWAPDRVERLSAPLETSPFIASIDTAAPHRIAVHSNPTICATREHDESL